MTSTRDNPVRRTFTPSYPAETREEYEQLVRTGKKRLEHVLVEGGRTTIRYGGPVPKLSASTKKRLAEEEPPWNARTQASEAHLRAHQPGGPRGEPDVAQIQAAINRYRETSPQGAAGLLVPHDPRPLIQAGMPSKAANILVRRAAGAFFPAVHVAAIRLAPELELEQDIARALGSRPSVRRGRLVVPVQGEQQPEEVQRVVVSAPGHEVVLSAADISTGYATWKEQIQQTRPYGPADDMVFLQRFYLALTETLRASERAWETKQLTVTVDTIRRGVRKERRLFVGEHSKPWSGAAPEGDVKYRSLRNVALRDLPPLLASLARRQKRKGRRLQPLEPTRSNPMADASSLPELVASKAAIGELVPVPGKPGRVYWPVTVRSAGGTRVVGLKETTERRASSWLRIAKAGRKAAPELSRVASQEPSISQENPMGRSRKNFDDRYFFEQYRQGPYGAQQAVPAARRNSGSKAQRRANAARAMSLFRSGQARSLKEAWQMVKANPGRAVLNGYARAATENRRHKRVKRKANPMAKAAFDRAKVIFSQQGCDWSTALRQAWADVKGARAAANPWYIPELVPSLYLPDRTQTRSSLVPSPYGPSDDFTQTRSALEGGAYSMPVVPNPHGAGRGRHPLRAARQLAQLHRFHEGLEESQLPPGVTLKHGGRGGGSGMFPIAQQGSATGLTYDQRFEDGHDQEGAYEHGQRAGADQDMWGYSQFWGGRQPARGAFAYRLGQFSPQVTSGFQPTNRRNPRKAKKNGKKKR